MSDFKAIYGELKTAMEEEGLITREGDLVTGMGEPGLPPLAPAFANAIARLTSKPLRQLPFNLA